MRVTLIQDIIFWADKAANIQKVEDQLILLAGTTDLVVLPEMFTTGFCTEKLQLAETMDGETVHVLKNWATSRMLSPSIRRCTSPGVAPRAIRTPISRI